MKNDNFFEMYKIHIFLDETECVLNEKMMPDLTVMVPELEINRKILKIQISKEKCTGSGVRVLTGGGEKNKKNRLLTSRIIPQDPMSTQF
jgi:hypothetical protein